MTMALDTTDTVITGKFKASIDARINYAMLREQKLLVQLYYELGK
jgi:hypothetical protein